MNLYDILISPFWQPHKLMSISYCGPYMFSHLNTVMIVMGFCAYLSLFHLNYHIFSNGKMTRGSFLSKQPSEQPFLTVLILVNDWQH